MAKRWFVSGTDTGVGKTYVSCGLLQRLNHLGLSTTALKPVASGCESSPAGWRNEDGLALQAAAAVRLPYEWVNPIALPLAAAPHIAAQQAGQTLNVARLSEAARPILAEPADICVIEGAGGWLTPLNEHETIADWVQSLHAEVILVVGMRLGCINHALLSYQAIHSSQVNCIAWVANCIDPDMLVLAENIATLAARLPMPLLAVVPYQGLVATHINSGLLHRLYQAGVAGGE